MMGASRIKCVMASVMLAACLVSCAPEPVGAAGLPINLNTQFSMTEHKMNTTGETTNRSSLTNNMSFSSLLPSSGLSSQKMNMSFSQANSFAGGEKSSSSNMTLFYGFRGSHYNFTNAFSMVENTNSFNQPQKNKNINMGLSMSWPKLPSMNVMFTSSSAGAQKSESNQMSMSYSLAKTSFNFNSIETAARTTSLSDSKASNKTLGISRQLITGKKLTVRSNLSVNRQNAFSGAFFARNKQDSLSFSVYDSHIKAVPLNLNLNAQKASQSSFSNNNSATSQSLNIFTTVSMPAEIRMNTSFNVSGSKNQDTPGTTRSRVFNVNLSRTFLEKAKVNYTYTRSASDGTAGDDSISRNSMMSAFVPVSKSTNITIQRGTTYSKTNILLVVPPPTKFSNVTITSTLRGGVTTSYQYNISDSESRIITENTSLTMPISRDITMNMYTTKKKLLLSTDTSMGMMANILLSRNMSVSTTWTEQKTKGVKSTLWNMGIMTMMRSRSTFTVGMTSQKTVEANTLSATLGVSMYL